MKKKLNLPQNFYWGSATSGPQSEANGFENALNGGKGMSIWEQWYEDDKTKFHNEKYALGNFLENFEQDIDIAKNLKFNSLRLSIQWSRLFPKNAKEINKEGVDFYHKVFNYANKQGIEIFVNLYHFDTPMWAQKMGGFESKEVVDAFANYAQFVTKEFKQIKKIAAMNEPTVSYTCGYQNGFHYPAVKSFKRSMGVMWNIMIAQVKAISQMRKEDPNKEYGTILSINKAIPRSNSKEDVEAAKWADTFDYKVFADPLIKGEYPMQLVEKLSKKIMFPLEVILEEELELIKNKAGSVDFLGINYYQPNRVKAVEKEIDWTDDSQAPFGTLYDHYDMPGKRINPHRGWEIYPKAVYLILKEMKEKYGNLPVFISENGMGVEGEEKFRGVDGRINDTYRIEFFEEHFYWIEKAISEGANVFGFHMWTYIDNWSWLNAYKNRYGFVELDIETKERREKLSADWIRKVITSSSMNVELPEDAEE